MTVLIAGASRGIGKALFDGYAARGVDVLGTHRAPDGGAMRHLDVTDDASLANLATQLGDKPIDLLICNAGVNLEKGKTFENGYPAAIWEDTFAANVTGVFMTIQSLLPNLRQSDQPKIAIIGSQMGSQTMAPGSSYVYCASKAAVLNIGRNLSADLAPEGFAVGVYHPGWVRTDMGGDNADLSVEESAAGLMDRFAALSVKTTGCFETWDGRPHPY